MKSVATASWGHGYKPRWSPEFFRLLYAIAKIEFITARIIVTHDFTFTVQYMIYLIYIISSSDRLVWRIFWCAAITCKLLVYQYLSQDYSGIFRKDCSLRPLSLQSPSTNYDSNHHKERSSKLLIRISKRLCCGVFRSEQTLLSSISFPDWLFNTLQ